MQRLDENTYIDDTLVTCAEYQLFIDEMREDGKYYEPDHWTSYQFPMGWAREPILGVRHSDAVAFCEWLTQREAEEWNYRLPTRRESWGCRMNPSAQLLFGYWIIDATDHFRFVWINPKPMDVRRITLTDTLNFIRSRSRALISTFDINIDIIRAGDIAIDEALASALDPIIDRYLARAFPRALNRARDRPLDLVSHRDRAIALNFGYDLVVDLNLALDRARERVIYSGIGRDRARDHALDEALCFIVASARESERDNGLTRMIVGALHRVFGPGTILEFVIDIFIDIFTMEERIAGRSPAFEGIRLVKEQK